jgi:hypothetical protein
MRLDDPLGDARSARDARAGGKPDERGPRRDGPPSRGRSGETRGSAIEQRAGRSVRQSTQELSNGRSARSLPPLPGQMRQGPRGEPPPGAAIDRATSGRLRNCANS